MPHTHRHYRFTRAGYVYLGVTAFVLAAAINSQVNLLFFAFGVMLGLLLLIGGLAAVAHLPLAANDLLRRLSRQPPTPALQALPKTLAHAFSTLGTLLDPVGALLLKNLSITRTPDPRGMRHQPLLLQYTIATPRRRWPLFAIHLTEASLTPHTLALPNAFLLHLPGGTSATLSAHVVPAHRGPLAFHTVRLTTAFPFGFVERTLYLPNPGQSLIYPRIRPLARHIVLRCREHLDAGALASNNRGGQDEFYGLRECRPGDNIKAIHWRRTARTGDLVLRELTANVPPQMVIALNLRPFLDHPPAPLDQDAANDRLEFLIETAAALTNYAFDQNWAVGLYVPGMPLHTLTQPQPGRDQRTAILDALATLSPNTASLPANPPQTRGKARMEWVILTPSAADPLADLIPPHASRTLLATDSPDAHTWLL